MDTGVLLLFAVIVFARLGLSSANISEVDGFKISATAHGPKVPIEHHDARERSSPLPGPDGAPLAYTAVHASYDPDAASAGPISDCVTDSVFEVLHTFTGGIDGIEPRTNVIQATDGNIYGTTHDGGAFNAGVVFRMTPDGLDYTILHAFAGGTDGALPSAALIEAADGNFYGTTAAGGGGSSCGSSGCGAVFQMTPRGTVTVLHAFTGGEGGAFPAGALVQGADGNLYGTTQYGGISQCGVGGGGCGIVFSITLDGTFTVLYAFNGVDGASPITPLVQGTDSNLYGTTPLYCPPDGSFFCDGGTVFKMTPQGALAVLFHFHPVARDDFKPDIGGLTAATDGSFYGVVGFDPRDGSRVYRVTADGDVTTVHTFMGGTDGNDIHGALIQADDGNFYGTTYSGGFGCQFSGCGTVFVMTPSGTVTALYFFAGGDDGASPVASLVQAMDGSFYGTTTKGGGAMRGVAFRLAPVFTLTASPEQRARATANSSCSAR